MTFSQFCKKVRHLHDHEDMTYRQIAVYLGNKVFNDVFSQESSREYSPRTNHYPRDEYENLAKQVVKMHEQNIKQSAIASKLKVSPAFVSKTLQGRKKQKRN